MKRVVIILLLLILLGGAGFVCVKYYSFVFAKNVKGEILRVERVSQPGAIIAGSKPIPTDVMFSFAVSIRDEKGEIHTASAEDRQWAIAASGQCAEAKFFPYPPWELDAAGTYFGARLVRLYDCPKKP